jgi:ATP-binding cassette subfamily B protein/ATP-binding cassette subfamily C protein
MKQIPLKANIIRAQKEISFAFSMLWKHQKVLFLLYPITHIVRLISSFVAIYFPLYLLDNLLNGNYTASCITVAVFIAWQLAADVINAFVGNVTSIFEGRYRDKISMIIYNKTTELRYEQLASTIVRQKYDFAQSCREKGSIQQMVSSVFSIITSVVLLVGIASVLRNFEWWLILIITAVMVANSIGKILRARDDYDHYEEEEKINRQINYYVDDIPETKYAKEIRAFSLTEFLAKKYADSIEDLFKLNKKYARKEIKVLFWARIVNAVERIFIYGYNVLEFFKGGLTAGQITMNISALQQFSGCIDSIASQIILIGEQSVYLEGFSGFLRIPSAYLGTSPLPEGEGVIEFKDVSFIYPGQEEYALKDVNVTMRMGEKLSIVGQNGAGKTTFVYLMLGLYKPTSGMILFNGVNIEEINTRAYADLFAPVLQDYNVFNFRILDNLLFDTNPSPEEITAAWDSLGKIGLTEAVNTLPGGIESYITQTFSREGIELSGGESQKLVIARNLLRNSPIMILDEPTAALSPQSEYDIYKSFDALTQSRMVIYISHRLASCSLANRILVFEKGAVTEQGSHRELISKNGLYAELYNRQLELYGIMN